MSSLPVIFIGHGSPMNAIEQNDFTQSLTQIGQNIPIPRAILVISAHWLSAGVYVTAMNNPRTIHDFYGFPEELFKKSYPSPGSPELAEQIHQLVKSPVVHLDLTWGLDHGTWSVLTHMYPRAQIPVLQLSIDISEPLAFHFELGRKLRDLRDQGILILGSGNIVHNLGRIIWGSKASPYPWAIEFDAWVKNHIQQNNFAPLYTDPLNSEAAKLSVPTLDHYLPLLYVLGAAHENERAVFEYEGIHLGSISMRSFQITS